MVSPEEDAFNTACAAFRQQLLGIYEGSRLVHMRMVIWPHDRFELLLPSTSGRGRESSLLGPIKSKNQMQANRCPPHWYLCSGRGQSGSAQSVFACPSIASLHAVPRRCGGLKLPPNLALEPVEHVHPALVHGATP